MLVERRRCRGVVPGHRLPGHGPGRDGSGRSDHAGSTPDRWPYPGTSTGRCIRKPHQPRASGRSADPARPRSPGRPHPAAAERAVARGPAGWAHQRARVVKVPDTSSSAWTQIPLRSVPPTSWLATSPDTSEGGRRQERKRRWPWTLNTVPKDPMSPVTVPRLVARAMTSLTKLGFVPATVGTTTVLTKEGPARSRHAAAEGGGPAQRCAIVREECRPPSWWRTACRLAFGCHHFAPRRSGGGRSLPFRSTGATPISTLMGALRRPGCCYHFLPDATVATRTTRLPTATEARTTRYFVIITAFAPRAFSTKRSSAGIARSVAAGRPITGAECAVPDRRYARAARGGRKGAGERCAIRRPEEGSPDRLCDRVAAHVAARGGR